MWFGSRRDRPWVIFFQVPVVIWLSAHEPTDAGERDVLYYGDRVVRKCAVSLCSAARGQCRLARVIPLARSRGFLFTVTEDVFVSLITIPSVRMRQHEDSLARVQTRLGHTHPL